MPRMLGPLARLLFLYLQLTLGKLHTWTYIYDVPRTYYEDPTGANSFLAFAFGPLHSSILIAENDALDDR